MGSIAVNIPVSFYAHNMVGAYQQRHVVPMQTLLQRAVKTIRLFGRAPGQPGLVSIAIDLRRADKSHARIPKVPKSSGEEILFRYEVDIMLGDNIILPIIVIQPGIIISAFGFFGELSRVGVKIFAPFSGKMPDTMFMADLF